MSPRNTTNLADTIVIGLGGIGSAALYHLATRGLKALGIERFGLTHDQGSSHGESRLIRRAYFEHPDYVPLVDDSFRGWNEIEKKSGRQIFHRTGLLLSGPQSGHAISGARRAAQVHGLDIQPLALHEIGTRLAPFCLPSDSVALLEPDAGTLAVEQCVRTHVELAQQAGATALFGERVMRWSAVDGGVTVETDAATYSGGSLIIAAGPWSSEILSGLGLNLMLRRKPVFWFAVSDPRYRRDQGCPVFGFEIDGHFLYGFPSIDGKTVKIGDHTGGDEFARADDVDRATRSDDLERITPFIEACLPGVQPRVVKESVCIYTMTPDEHFIVDRHPDHSNVVFAAGLSGHGFKFAPVLASALADTAVTGRIPPTIDFLRLDRPGLQGL